MVETKKPAGGMISMISTKRLLIVVVGVVLIVLLANLFRKWESTHAYHLNEFVSESMLKGLNNNSPSSSSYAPGTSAKHTHLPLRKSLDEVVTSSFDILIIGAGLSGSVFADLLARHMDKKVLMIDRRDHVGGNCFDFKNKGGILQNKYGAHLFHTNFDDVWEYVHRFGEWVPYEHRVVGRVDNKLVPIPVNIDTVNILLGKDITSKKDMEEFMSTIVDKGNGEPKNGEEAAIGRVGRELYNKIFREYTKKQWNVYPDSLDASVLQRIPVRSNWDDRYFPDDVYQALPKFGYTKWFESVLAHPNIEVAINADFFDIPKSDVEAFERVIFTGPIDQYFQNIGSKLDSLEYRSINFHPRDMDANGFGQAAGVINYPQMNDGDFTRCVDYKHFYNQDGNRTTLLCETSTDSGEPYYPFPDDKNKALYEQYRNLAVKEESKKTVHFVGRLANYKYFDMDDTIHNALSMFSKIFNVKPSSFLPKITIPSPMFRVNVVINMNQKQILPPSYLNALCLQLYPADVHVYVYARSAAVTKAMLEEQLAGCAASVHLVNLPNYGQHNFAWLSYMFGADFEFADVNVFLRGEDKLTPASLNRIVLATAAIAKNLFYMNATKASSPFVRDTNIVTEAAPFGVFHHLETSNLLAIAETNHKHSSAYFREDDKASGGDSMEKRTPNHMLHYVSLREPTQGIKQLQRNSGSMGKVFANDFCETMKRFFPNTAKRDCQHVVYSAGPDFIATEAGLRRMITRHREQLLVMVDQLKLSETPIVGEYMDRLWSPLFFGPNTKRKTVS
eukprot:m.42705 g.42705  ORF g.42705 m.42705 type:complete len:788 (-) comp7071_c0_seq1:222-2585(-)